jgi:hypothetical protein
MGCCLFLTCIVSAHVRDGLQGAQYTREVSEHFDQRGASSQRPCATHERHEVSSIGSGSTSAPSVVMALIKAALDRSPAEAEPLLLLSSLTLPPKPIPLEALLSVSILAQATEPIICTTLSINADRLCRHARASLIIPVMDGYPSVSPPLFSPDFAKSLLREDMCVRVVCYCEKCSAPPDKMIL